ncbi:MAG: hypothetical protein RMM08_01955, partial [Armatimonadota bacterium]|nr:hypothetical protein [Armatimonadota bacterium]
LQRLPAHIWRDALCCVRYPGRDGARPSSGTRILRVVRTSGLEGEAPAEPSVWSRRSATLQWCHAER